MTNRKKYEHYILTECAEGRFSIFFNKYIKPNLSCKLFKEYQDFEIAILTNLWLESQCKSREVDWSKIEVDTPIWVSDCGNGDWFKRHFAKYENGKVYAFEGGNTSWSDPYNLTHWEYARLADHV